MASGTGMTMVVMGLARSGLAAARLLLHHGWTVHITDIKTLSELSDSVADLQAAALSPIETSPGTLSLHLGHHPEQILDNASGVVLSPGIPLTVPFLQAAMKRGIPIISEVELAARHLQGMILGITGSNGKSTTTTLTAHILRASGRPAIAAGNIGTPLASLVEDDTTERIYVTELSSFQLETIQDFRPRIATILNLTPDHLDRYPDMDAYVDAKWRIFNNMGKTDVAVLNANDPLLVKGRDRLRCPLYMFDAINQAKSPEKICGAGVFGGITWINLGSHPEMLIPVRDIPLPGKHNLENVLAASLMARLAGAETNSLAVGIRTFRALAHRLEKVAEINGRLFYNDSKATNVDATLLALKAFERPIVLILGGRDKGSPYTPLIPELKGKCRKVLVIGEATPCIERDLMGQVEIEQVDTLENAIFLAYALSHPGDVILLSPACASYDMFRNFEHRGDVFREVVLELSGRRM